MGWSKETLSEGKGTKPKKGDTITVECTAFLKQGNKQFWTTLGDKPFEFQVGLGKVIRGWDEGMLDVALGEKARLDISWDYAYGDKGFPAWGIPPKADLIFEVEVLNIKS